MVPLHHKTRSNTNFKYKATRKENGKVFKLFISKHYKIKIFISKY